MKMNQVNENKGTVKTVVETGAYTLVLPGNCCFTEQLEQRSITYTFSSFDVMNEFLREHKMGPYWVSEEK